MRGDRLDYATERTQTGEATGGHLNPTWVEWLMGWPVGWTDLKPLETDKFPQWRHSHGKPSHETSETVTTFNPNNL